MKLHVIGLLTGLLQALAIGACTPFNEEALPTATMPPAFPGEEWVQVEDPAVLGWNVAKLAEARKFGDQGRSASVMVVDSGRLVAAWGNTADKYYVASVRKSFLSALYGPYVESGAIDLDATLAQLNISDSPGPLNAQEQQATVRHLLLTSSGVYHDAAAAGSVRSQRKNRPARNSHKPGTFWFYNNWDFNALGAIFEQQTQQGIFDAFFEQIAQPIGMEDWNPGADGRYTFIEESEHPAYVFDMTARDMARFGLLFMHQGNWNGQQLIPQAWVEESTQALAQVSDERGGGSYGYMWWVSSGGNMEAFGIPDGTFSAQGTYDQFILVIPQRNIVIVHRGRVGLAASIRRGKVAQMMRLILEAQEG